MIMTTMEILFLIFGWVFAVKGLVIASLVLSTFWFIVIFVLVGMGCKENSKSKIVKGLDFLCMCLSIVCLCVRF